MSFLILAILPATRTLYSVALGLLHSKPGAKQAALHGKAGDAACLVQTEYMPGRDPVGSPLPYGPITP